LAASRARLRDCLYLENKATCFLIDSPLTPSSCPLSKARVSNPSDTHAFLRTSRLGCVIILIRPHNKLPLEACLPLSFSFLTESLAFVDLSLRCLSRRHFRGLFLKRVSLFSVFCFRLRWSRFRFPTITPYCDGAVVHQRLDGRVLFSLDFSATPPLISFFSVAIFLPFFFGTICTSLRNLVDRSVLALSFALRCAASLSAHF